MQRAAIVSGFFHPFRLACLLTLATISIAGCGDSNSGPATVGVSGTIYLDDQPLSDAVVTFTSTSADFSAKGRTNSEGRYTLAQGAVPGKNTVTVEKWEGGDDLQMNPEEGMDEGQLEAMADPGATGNVKVDSEAKQLIPQHYSDPEKSDLSLEVPEKGTKSADFRLQGK